MGIAQGMSVQPAVKRRGEKHPAPVQQLAAVGHLFGRVVVAADGKDGFFQPAERHQKIAYGANSLRRGLRLVVEIACQQHRVALPGHLHGLCQHGPLIVQQANAAQPAPDVQIGQVQKAHGIPSLPRGPGPAGLWYLFFLKKTIRVHLPFSEQML